MIHRLHIPQYPLSEFIDHFWYVQSGKLDSAFKYLPDAEMEFMINFGAPFKVFSDDSMKDYSLMKKGWVSGTKTKPVIVDNIDGYDMIGVRFKKGKAYQFFSFPLSEVNSRVIELDLIWGNLVNEIRDQLGEFITIEEKFQTLEGRLLCLLGNKGLNKTDPFITRALKMIEESEVDLTIKQLVDKFGISHKHFLRKFDSQFGTNPKMFNRINKFQRAIHLIYNSELVHWTRLAYECNYYDQSHFIREFKYFTGVSPANFFINQGEHLNAFPLRSSVG
jgi:AraC-like DNA-binding protein